MISCTGLDIQTVQSRVTAHGWIGGDENRCVVTKELYRQIMGGVEKEEDEIEEDEGL